MKGFDLENTVIYTQQRFSRKVCAGGGQWIADVTYSSIVNGLGTQLGAKWNGPCHPSPFRSAASSVFDFPYFADRFKASLANFVSVCVVNRSEFGLEVHSPPPWLTQKETAH